MRFQTRSRHVIDFIFPISLFFVFAASSLAVLILAADIYGSTTKRMQVNDESRTALAYIWEKIRQSDVKGPLEITTIEHTDCLAISMDYEGISCTTYIYEQEGMLRELFVRDGASFSLKDGRAITEIGSLSMEFLGDGLYYFTVVDSQGNADSLIAAERSVP